MTRNVPARRPAGFFAIALAGAALAGCYHGTARDVSPAQLRAQAGWTIVPGVPELRQSSPDDCGVVALAMILHRWGAPSSSPAELKSELLPNDDSDSAQLGDAGVTAGELRDLARRRGLQVFLIRARIDDLLRELDAGRPVLVGLKQGYSDRTLSHYEVVVGINARSRHVLLFDPGHGPREDAFDGFASEWEPTGGLAIVVTGWASGGVAAALCSALGSPRRWAVRVRAAVLSAALFGTPILPVGLGLSTLACGTTYQPRSSPRVGLVVHHGSVVYVQNGHEEPIGAMGGDLPGLVAATPAAASHARKARTELGVGVPSYVIGLGGVVLGLTVLSGPIGWVVIGVGASLGGTGLGLMGAGVTNALDAVNIHNDHVGAESSTPAPPAAAEIRQTHDIASSRR